MSEEASAPVVASPASAKKSTTSTKSKVPIAKSSHPSTSVMVTAAVTSLKERNGSSVQAIKKFISGTYMIDAEKQASFIKKYLKSAVEKGELIQTKGKGASGSFKLGSAAKSSVAKPKAAAKPKTATKKPTTSKKEKPATKKVDAAKKTAVAKKSPTKKAAPKKDAPAGKKTVKAASPKKPAAKKSPVKKTAKSPTAKPKAPKPKKATTKTTKASAKK